MGMMWNVMGNSQFAMENDGTYSTFTSMIHRLNIGLLKKLGETPKFGWLIRKKVAIQRANPWFEDKTRCRTGTSEMLKLFGTSLDKLLDCFSTKHLSKPGDFTDFHDPFGTWPHHGSKLPKWWISWVTLGSNGYNPTFQWTSMKSRLFKGNITNHLCDISKLLTNWQA